MDENNSNICVDANNPKLNVRQNVVITKQYFKNVDNVIFNSNDKVKNLITTYISTDKNIETTCQQISQEIGGNNKTNVLAQLNELCANFNNDLKNNTDYEKYKTYAELISLCLLFLFVVRLLKSKPHIMYELIIVITSFMLPKIAINIVKQYENKLSIAFNVSKYTSAITAINDLKRESECIDTLHESSLKEIIILFYDDNILDDDKVKTRMNTITLIQKRLLGMKNYMLKTENSNIVTDEIDEIIKDINENIYDKNILGNILFEEEIPNLVNETTITTMNNYELSEVNLKYLMKKYNEIYENELTESESRNLYKILVYIQKECINRNKSFFYEENKTNKTRWINLNVFKQKFKDDSDEKTKFKEVVTELKNDIELYVKYLNDDDKVYNYDLMIAAEYDNLLKWYFIISFIYLINYMADVWFDKINVIGLAFLKQRNIYKTSESYERKKNAVKDRKKKIQQQLQKGKTQFEDEIKRGKEFLKGKGTELFKNLMKGGEDEEDDDDDDDDDDYSIIDTDYIQLAIVSSFWLLTYLILYNYLSKYKSELQYNKIILSENTKKIQTSISQLTNALNNSNDENTIQEIHESMITLLDSYEKCNMLRSDYNSVPFPYTIILTNITILILCVLVIWFMYKNMINNNNTELKKEISKIEAEFTELKNVERSSSSTTQSGGGGMSNFEKMKLNKLKDLRNRLYFIENKNQFNNIITAFCITSFSLYVGINMFYSTMNYDNMLYSGTLYRTSKCFKM